MSDDNSLFKMLGKFDQALKDLPPVDQWNPELSGHMDMIIKSNGDWVHEGDVIEKDKLSRLFSTIIRKEGGEYYLVTPVEKWRIIVEDQPFSAVLCEIHGGCFKIVTNMGEEVELLTPSQLVLDEHEAPKILIRKNLYARLNRPTYYEVISHAIEVNGQYFIQSNGEDFRVG